MAVLVSSAVPPSNAPNPPCLRYYVQALWALLLDLAACPGAAVDAVLPPLAAVLDMWPSLVQPPADGSSPAPASSSHHLPRFHAALQHLCSQATAAAGEPTAAEEAAAGSAPDAPPPLLLERQPVAAAVCLRLLGERRWGWEAGAAGSGQALLELRAAVEAQQPGAAPAAGAGVQQAAKGVPAAAAALAAQEIAAAHGAEEEEI